MASPTDHRLVEASERVAEAAERGNTLTRDLGEELLHQMRQVEKMLETQAMISYLQLVSSTDLAASGQAGRDLEPVIRARLGL